MRIHTNVLTASEIQAATPVNVYAEIRKTFNSRSRANGYDVTLIADPDSLTPEGEKRRAKNQSTSGRSAGYFKAATYDEHGEWMARLFEMDEEMVLDSYKGADDFHAKTRFAYVIEG